MSPCLPGHDWGHNKKHGFLIVFVFEKCILDFSKLIREGEFAKSRKEYYEEGVPPSSLLNSALVSLSG